MDSLLAGRIEQIFFSQQLADCSWFIKTSVNAFMNLEKNCCESGMIFLANQGRYESEIIRFRVNGV